MNNIIKENGSHAGNNKNLKTSTVNLSSQKTSTNHDEPDNPQRPRPEYRFEAARLSTFNNNWPAPFMDPRRLAAAGFYFTGVNDNVKCFECGIEINNWVEGDNPLSDHQRYQSNCRFIRKVPCGNVPIGVDPSTIPAPAPRSSDICGRYGVEIRPDAVPDFRIGKTEVPIAATLSSLGLTKQKGPKHPQYASYDARLATFATWPQNKPHSKEQLSDAGFFYTGTSDQTLCYHCGGGLKDWEADDDPWDQHAKYFSKCYYVLTVKGQAYINQVNGRNIPVPTREETLQMDLPSFIKRVNPDQQQQQQQQSIINSPKGKPTDDARICKVCYNEDLGVVFLPCGHIVACIKCAPSMSNCCVCHEAVSMFVRAFIS